MQSKVNLRTQAILDFFMGIILKVAFQDSTDLLSRTYG